jgi:uncharacterized paraquat-inducible protein A
MEKFHGNTVEYWRKNAEENYMTTPISVLKYITVLEEQANDFKQRLCSHGKYVVDKDKQMICTVCGKVVYGAIKKQ